MVFSNSNAIRDMDINIVINNNNIDENSPNLIFPVKRVKKEDDVPAVRFLGVYFDPNLNFDYHIKLIASKISKALYILRSTQKFSNY